MNSWIRENFTETEILGEIVTNKHRKIKFKKKKKENNQLKHCKLYASKKEKNPEETYEEMWE